MEKEKEKGLVRTQREKARLARKVKTEIRIGMTLGKTTRSPRTPRVAIPKVEKAKPEENWSALFAISLGMWQRIAGESGKLAPRQLWLRHPLQLRQIAVLDLRPPRWKQRAQWREFHYSMTEIRIHLHQPQRQFLICGILMLEEHHQFEWCSSSTSTKEK